jgi:hypothetical protein
MREKLKSLKHSKIKNTGLLFEVLSRKFSEEVISNSRPKAINLLKKYFHNSEIAKEYNLYKVILGSNSLNESQANLRFDILKESYSKIDKEKLSKEKYNLIREVKDLYSNSEDIFKFRVDNYNVLAATNNLLESFNSTKYIEPSFLLKNKSTILEHLITVPKTESSQILESFTTLPKSEQQMVFDLMVEKFNKKFKVLTESQKAVLKEYISQNNSPKFTEYISEKFDEVVLNLKLKEALIEDVETKTLLKETISTIKPFGKNYNIKNDDVVKLLNCYSLVDELENFQDDEY